MSCKLEPHRSTTGRAANHARPALVKLGACLIAASILVACQSEPSASQSPNAEQGSASNAGAATDNNQAVKGQPVESQPVENLWTRSQGEDWPAFLGPRGDGTSLETGIDPQRWDPHPPLLWQLKLGMSYGGPAVVKGRVLQFDRDEERLTGRERLRCLKAETGAPLWEWSDPVEYQDMYGYNSGPRCMPIVDSDRVYLYGVSGKLSCVKLADGQILWQRDMTNEYGVVQNFFGVASTPLVYHDQLLVMVGGSPRDSQHVPTGRLDMVKPNGSAIVSLDKKTGKELYRVGNELASYSSPRACRIGESDLGLAFVRGGLLAWDLRDGRERFMFPWRAPMLESVNAAQPVVDGNKVLLSETYDVGSVLLEIEQGQSKVLWQDGSRRSEQAFRAHWSTPVLIDGHLYGCSGRNQPDADFRCVRLSDGEVLWSVRKHERASVLAVDGYLIVLYEDGVLELVRPSTEKYDVVRTVDLNAVEVPGEHAPLLDEPCWAAPVLAHGLLFLRGNSRLLCFDLIPSP
ncbi:MAG: PQQ-binding-like beta-propeller repeat protein [Aureliella sp.]